MKRILAAFLLSITILSSAFSFTDSFKSMNESPEFLSLLDVIKNGGEYSDAERAYSAYIATSPSYVDRTRVCYHMIRYYMDKGNKSKAEEYLSIARDSFSKIPSNASQIEKSVADADLTAAEYYITKKMGTGMENSNKTKELYKNYPDEFYVALQEAFRLLYTPPIAGGNSRRALRIVNSIESNKEGISKLDNYSLLVAKAMALSKTESYSESNKYLDEAEKIYTFDTAFEDIRKDNRRGLR